MCGVPKGCEGFQRYDCDIQSLFFLCGLCLCYSSDFFPPSFVGVLATANARIASLEAELEALQKAYDATTAAKRVAENSQKSAIARAKKAERALADANKGHAQREQAVAERLHTMSSAAASKFFDLPFCFRLLMRWCTR
jgi:glycyl-tRNA synthetase beta subunit